MPCDSSFIIYLKFHNLFAASHVRKVQPANKNSCSHLKCIALQKFFYMAIIHIARHKFKTMYYTAICSNTNMYFAQLNVIHKLNNNFHRCSKNYQITYFLFNKKQLAPQISSHQDLSSDWWNRWEIMTVFPPYGVYYILEKFAYCKSFSKNFSKDHTLHSI